MTYFKVLVLILLLFIIQPVFAFYSTKWQEVYKNDRWSSDGVNSVYVDADSVNIHNDSVYYAIKYYSNKGEIAAIVQSKNNKAGIVETFDGYEYDRMMHDHVNYPHPAYTAKDAKELKELNPNSYMYKANQAAKNFVMLKKTNPSALRLSNGLYGI